MFTPFSLLSAVRRSLALAVVAGSAVAIAGAQTVPAADNAVAPQPATFQLSSPVLGSTSEPLFSSSAEDTDDAVSQATEMNLASLEKSFALPNANAQYGGRRRYGAPRYRGSNTNADGSEKYTIYAGAGFGIPVGTNSNYLTTGYGIQVGGGRNFNKHLGVALEFDYDHFGMTTATIDNQSLLYFGDSTNANGLGANSHIWNFSIQPTYQIYSGQGLGAYLTAGVGFYHKVANFTLPQTEEECEGFYGCYEFTANANVDHYTSNAPGFDGGIGLTYKFSRFANERLFAEVRYVYVDNSYRPGVTDATAENGQYTGNNYFPQNSNTTSYIPVKFGIRF